MRVAGLILVCLGALALGSHRFADRGKKTGPVSPLTGGIVLVSGLLLLAGRRPAPGREQRVSGVFEARLLPWKPGFLLEVAQKPGFEARSRASFQSFLNSSLSIL